jgi:disulfide bond formation protein DsbB
MLENMLTLNSWVATGTLIFEIAILGKLISLVIMSMKESEFKKSYKEVIYGTKESIFKSFGVNVFSERFLVAFIFIFSLIASVMTLVYSEIFLQEPCSLCWFQRVFMYGITLMSAIALYFREEKFITKYILGFSFVGMLFALYQHAEQMLALRGTHLPCPTSGADCSKMTLFEYGHITFPWMAVVMFVSFIIIILLQRKLR